MDNSWQWNHGNNQWEQAGQNGMPHAGGFDNGFGGQQGGWNNGNRGNDFMGSQPGGWNNGGNWGSGGWNDDGWGSGRFGSGGGSAIHAGRRSATVMSLFVFGFISLVIGVIIFNIISSLNDWNNWDDWPTSTFPDTRYAVLGTPHAAFEDYVMLDGFQLRPMNTNSVLLVVHVDITNNSNTNWDIDSFGFHIVRRVNISNTQFTTTFFAVPGMFAWSGQWGYYINRSMLRVDAGQTETMIIIFDVTHSAATLSNFALYSFWGIDGLRLA